MPFRPSTATHYSRDGLTLIPCPVPSTTLEQLRDALYGTGGSPSNGSSVVYGYARANLRPFTYTYRMGFRLQGPHTRIYINNQLIVDFQHDTQQMVVTPCVTLQNNTAHELFFYFATQVGGCAVRAAQEGVMPWSDVKTAFPGLVSRLVG